MAMRVAEVKETYEVMQRLARGEGEALARENVRICGAKGFSSSGSAPPVDWSFWQNHFQAETDVTLAGHSFGGATVVSFGTRLNADYTWADATLTDSLAAYGVRCPASRPSSSLRSMDGASARPSKPRVILASRQCRFARDKFARFHAMG